MGFAEPWQLLLYLSDLPRLEGQVFFCEKKYKFPENTLIIR